MNSETTIIILTTRLEHGTVDVTINIIFRLDYT